MMTDMELKAYTADDIQELDDERLEASESGKIDCTRVYIKSEADAVIKELKAKKSQAEDDCVFWKKKYNDCKRELDLLKDTNTFYNGGLK